MTQLKPPSKGTQEARPSSQCRLTNCQWRATKSAFTAFMRMSAGFLSPGHCSRAKPPERTRSCTHSCPTARCQTRRRTAI
eukprot:15175901-Alexandrium_andersonii.AAC.1